MINSELGGSDGVSEASVEDTFEYGIDIANVGTTTIVAVGVTSSHLDTQLERYVLNKVSSNTFAVSVLLLLGNRTSMNNPVTSVGKVENVNETERDALSTRR